jgi:hypothetical protein
MAQPNAVLLDIIETPGRTGSAGRRGWVCAVDRLPGPWPCCLAETAPRSLSLG